ncbi:hypothetical protein UFOVP98_61 [uncultured Caudovirales phage]|uniref:Uncharacterized protein n=1 Tax=uncultured Caudovirales phage TaxID=2100421 RepID=A0A6J5L2N3_9CAUD|nr:hypothetical protein UFOVP98_61 [uncultured Caudovirales phage]CAB4134108.1 hypothetical protein UFOVP269_10 [uncultured Caudovirales phage]
MHVWIECMPNHNRLEPMMHSMRDFVTPIERISTKYQFTTHLKLFDICAILLIVILIGGL